MKKSWVPVVSKVFHVSFISGKFGETIVRRKDTRNFLNHQSEGKLKFSRYSLQPTVIFAKLDMYIFSMLHRNIGLGKRNAIFVIEIWRFIQHT